MTFGPLLRCDRAGARARCREPCRSRGRAGQNPPRLGRLAARAAAHPVRARGHRAPSGPVLYGRAAPLPRHLADDHRLRRGRGRYRPDRLSVLRLGGAERRDERFPHPRRRVSRRGRRLLFVGRVRAEGRRHRQGRGPEGQGAGDQCDRHRRLYRHDGGARAAPSGRAPRLHRDRGAVREHDLDAAGT